MHRTTDVSFILSHACACLHARPPYLRRFEIRSVVNSPALTTIKRIVYNRPPVDGLDMRPLQPPYGQLATPWHCRPFGVVLQGSQLGSAAITSVIRGQRDSLAMIGGYGER